MTAATVTATRPSFAAAWSKFSLVFGAGDLSSAGDLIGGKVKYNIDLGKSEPLLGFTNGCAIRMSYVLNHTGVPIPFIRNEVSSGADGKWYIFRVRTLISFLKERLGPPDKTILNPALGSLKGEKGILVFEVDAWSDAEGHATLWDGFTCSDKCYFPIAQKAHLWRLK